MADPNYNDVVLLLHGNGTDGSTTFTDSGPLALTPTSVAGNVQIDTSQFQWGGASILFDGTGDWLSYGTNSAFAFGTSDFTIEGWIRLNTLGTFKGIFATGAQSAGSQGFTFRVRSNNTLEFFHEGGAVINMLGVTALTTGTWYHVAVTRSGNTFRMFLSGVLEDTETSAVTGGSSDVRVGAQSGGSFPFNGWIDDFRVTSGVARYTSNFTPPTEEFPNSADTDTAGDLAVTEAQDSSTINGTNLGIIEADLVVTETQDDFSLSAAVLGTIEASFAVTEAQDTLEIDAFYFDFPIAELAFTEPQDGFLSLGGTIDAAAGLFAAVGEQRIFKTPDGLSWTEVVHDISTSEDFRGIAQNDTGRWVIVGTGSSIWYSDDLETWTPATTVPTANYDLVRYGGGMFVAIGGPSIVSSSDGIIWTLSQTALNSMRGLRYGNGNWVAAGDNGRVYSSSDGITWTLRSISPNTGLSIVDVGWNGSQFIIGSGTHIVLTSTTGTTWTRRTDVPGGGSIQLYYGGDSIFIAAAGASSSRSTNNAASWSSFTSRPGTSSITSGDGIYDDGTFVEVQRSHASGSNWAFISSDGLTWSNIQVVNEPLGLSSVAHGTGMAIGYVFGPLIATEEQDSFSISASYLPVFHADLAVTEAQDIFLVQGVSFADIGAELSVTEEQDLVNIFVTRDFADITIDFAVTESQDLAAFVVTRVSGVSRIVQIRAEETPDTVALRLSTTGRITFALTETPDTLLMRQGGEAMPIQILPATFDHIVTYGASLFDGGELTIYSGSQPLSPSDPAVGTMLGVITLPNPAFNEAEDGTATKVGDWESAATATGVAGWFRLTSSDGNHIVDGSVTTPEGTGNLIVNTTSFTVGDPLIVETAIFQFQLLDELEE